LLQDCYQIAICRIFDLQALEAVCYLADPANWLGPTIQAPDSPSQPSTAVQNIRHQGQSASGPTLAIPLLEAVMQLGYLRCVKKTATVDVKSLSGDGSASNIFKNHPKQLE